MLMQSTFSKGRLYHFFTIAFVLLLSTLGIFLGVNGEYVLGYGVLGLFIAFFIFGYIKTPTDIDIGYKSLDINYPFTKDIIPYSDMEDIVLKDEFHKANRVPIVSINLKSVEKPFELRDFRADSIAVYIALRKAASF